MNDEQIIPLIKTIEDKQVVWFQKGNKYVLTNAFEADALLKICMGENLSDIKKWCYRVSNFTYDEARFFIESIQQLVEQQNKETESFDFYENRLNFPIEFVCKKHYRSLIKFF